MTALLTPIDGFNFPERNDKVAADWLPIFLEPMVGSGERICIGVAVVNNDGALVVPVVALSRLACLYGADVDVILSSANFALNKLRDALESSGPKMLHDWRSPIEGIYTGSVSKVSGASLEDIARMGLAMSASLVEQLAETEDSDIDAGDRMSGPRLESLVKQRVVAIRPALESAFGHHRKLGVNVRSVTIGFVGRAIAANFGVLVPQQLSANVKDIKAKLWDLTQLREDFGQPSLVSATINRYEMLVHRPSDDQPEYSEKQLKNIGEAVNELEAEADKKDVRCRSLTGPDLIADVLLEAEAA